MSTGFWESHSGLLSLFIGLLYAPQVCRVMLSLCSHSCLKVSPFSSRIVESVSCLQKVSGSSDIHVRWFQVLWWNLFILSLYDDDMNLQTFCSK
jgi:hypothetical protein